jgi:hypothetical protein
MDMNISCFFLQFSQRQIVDRDSFTPPSCLHPACMNLPFPLHFIFGPQHRKHLLLLTLIFFLSPSPRKKQRETKKVFP